MPLTLLKSAVFAVCLFSVFSAAHARTVTLAGDGVTIRYEDKAAELTGVPSLIATSLMAGTTSFAGLQHIASASAFSVAAVAHEKMPRSFAEGLNLRFSVDDGADSDRGLYSMLLAGIGLFGLVARRRFAALSRSRISPGFL